METQSLIQNIKQEPDYEVQTVRKEANGEEESYMVLVINRASTSSTSLSGPNGNSFLYCEKCQLKYEGGCPEHGTVTYIDNVEEGQGEGCIEDSSHSDDVGTLPNRGCSTESDEIVSVCEMNTELCAAGTSCGVKSNVEIKGGHKIHNSEKPFSCDVCGVGFVENSTLKTHMRSHAGEKPYKCDVCSLGFTRQCDLKIHKRTHTGEKPYKCDVCGLRCTQQGDIKKHMRIHTGEKPYKCHVCGLEFTRQDHLKTHKRTHTGEKPYKCDVCGVRCNRISNLKQHKRIHTGEKPYKCGVCGVEFAQRGNLNRHKKTHT